MNREKVTKIYFTQEIMAAIPPLYLNYSNEGQIKQ